MSINLHPSFKAFFKFANVNFVREEMVWQTVPFFDDIHEERVLKGVNFSSFSFYFLWMVGCFYFYKSLKLPLQIGILFDAEVCSRLAIYIVLHISRVVLTDSDSRCSSLYFFDCQLIFK